MEFQQDMNPGFAVTRSFDETTHTSNSYGSKDNSKCTDPASSLLQERLREKKAESRRLSKGLEFESHNHTDPREIQSSPIGPRAGRSDHSRHTSGLGARSVSIPKEMGMRQMEDYISKINKQNFDLKLEIFHRRQRQESLEKQKETLEAELAEAQKINDALLKELEKREEAVKEAVTMICGLEEKVETFEKAEALRTQSAGAFDPTNSDDTEKLTIPPSSPLVSLRRTNTPMPESILRNYSPAAHPLSSIQTDPRLTDPRTPRRQPSFLKENDGSSKALRSLYLSKDIEDRGALDFAPMTKPTSLFSADEDGETANIDRHTLKSPSLSALSLLSESGFRSMYGGNSDQGHTAPGVDLSTYLNRNAAEYQPSSTQRPESRQSTRIRQWMEGDGSPSRKGRISPQIGRSDKIHSIGEILQKEDSSTNSSIVHPLQRINRNRDPSTDINDRNKGKQTEIMASAFNEPMLSPASNPCGNLYTPDAHSASRPLLDITPAPSSLGWANSAGFGPDEFPRAGSAIREVHEAINEKEAGYARVADNMRREGWLSAQGPPQSYSARPTHSGWHSLRRHTPVTPSPANSLQHQQAFKNPEAQHYQQLVTPPSASKNKPSRTNSGTKLPRMSSLRRAASKLPFRRASSHAAKFVDNAFDDVPLDSPAHDVDSRLVRSSSIATSSVPRASLHQQTTPSRIARPSTAGITVSRRPISPYLNRGPSRAYDDSTTASEEAIATPSTASRDDFAIEGEYLAEEQEAKLEERTLSSESRRGLMSEGKKTTKWSKGKMMGRNAGQRLGHGIKRNFPEFFNNEPEVDEARARNDEFEARDMLAKYCGEA